MVVDEASFSVELIHELRAEWDAVQRGFESDLIEWLVGFDGMAKEYEVLLQKGRWTYGRDDFFGVLRMGRAEMAHSAMLAWLIDPLGRHGLGRRLLDRLIAVHLPGVDSSVLRFRSVELEVQRQETRADIVVWADVATLIIEVKVDAGEGDRQCDRLYQRFSDEPGSTFVFLTPTGRRPLTATGEARDAFVPISFPQIADALEAVLAGFNGGEAGDVARNYLRTTRAEFG